jgi:peptidoglycan/LPS O-acetylase OafA/YrhL
MPTPTYTSRPQLPALTSLRFFAAAHVVFFHLHADQIRNVSGLASRLQLTGYLGVSLFFVLSGFILTYVHADRDLSPSFFYRERFARIYPAYFFSLIFTALPFFYVNIALKNMDIPFFAWTKYHVGLCAILVPTLTQSWVPLAALAWNPPAWSLSVEAFFYVLFPFVLPRILRWSDRRLWTVMTSCWVVALTLSGAYVLLSPDGVRHVTDDSLNLFWLSALKFNPLVRLPEFILGSCCSVLFLRGKFNQPWSRLLLPAGLIAFAAVVLASPYIPYPLMHNAIMPPAFAAIIVGLGLRPAYMRWLENRFLVLLGNASYSLYLLHSIVLGIYFAPKGTPIHYSRIGFTIGLILPIVIAILVYKLIEEPLRRKLRPKSAPPILAATAARTA